MPRRHCTILPFLSPFPRPQEHRSGQKPANLARLRAEWGSRRRNRRPISRLRRETLPKMTHNWTVNRPFVWTTARQTALQLVVEGRLTDIAIARQVGVCRRTLGYWKAHPDFVAAAEQLVDDYAKELRRDAVRRYRL